MSKQSFERKILLDADVIIHFQKAVELGRLPLIFPNQFVILDVVYKEVSRIPHLLTEIDNMIIMFKIPVLDFPPDREILIEYSKLKKLYGPGESACMAVARFQKQFIASSNLRDLKEYCSEHSIQFYTTMDLLEIALSKGVFNEDDCDNFIRTVKAKNSKLPVNTMKEFLELKSKTKTK
jgi:hypothetical protein